MNEDLKAPENLDEKGSLAHAAITTLLAKKRMTYTGGCKAFYSPAQWEERGEEYGRGALLIVCHDGGDLAPFFNHDYQCYASMEKMRKALERVGCFVEQCTSWYSAVYLIT